MALVSSLDLQHAVQLYRLIELFLLIVLVRSVVGHVLAVHVAQAAPLGLCVLLHVVLS